MRGWWVAVACGVGVAGAAGLCLAAEGGADEGWAAAIRITARSTALLFALVYGAAPLAARWPGFAWLRANRRYLGVAAAVSHVLHLVLIVTRAIRTDGESLAGRVWGGYVIGGIGYAVLLAMAVTSTDRTAAWLGPKAWRRLLTFGLHLLWLFFAVAYTGRSFVEPVFLPMAGLYLGLAGLRFTGRRSRRLPGTGGASGSPISPGP